MNTDCLTGTRWDQLFPLIKACEICKGRVRTHMKVLFPREDYPCWWHRLALRVLHHRTRYACEEHVKEVVSRMVASR